MFETALVAGICSQGVDAVLVGPIPTPAISFITKSLRANAGIVISASHNPYYDNGIKFFDSEGYKLPDELEEKLEAMVDSSCIPVSSNLIGRVFRIETAVGRYVEFVKATFNKDLDLRGLRIVVDCANGASYRVAPLAVEELGADMIVINNKPNGVNINDNCGATAPQAMAEAVVKHRADIGISFDGDGDRLIVCDNKGNIIDGDFIMGICAIFMKDKGLLQRDTVVATVMSNQGFVQSLKKYDIDVIRSNVGDRYVLERMREGGYNVGGEQSGHIIFSDYIATGDGLISALQLLKVMVTEQKSLEELASQITAFPQLLMNIEVSKKVPIEQLPKTSALIKDISDKLGASGRVLVRYSGTENKLRIMTEGEDQAMLEKYTQNIAESAKDEIRIISD
jgi:phosphoglucosamine mutase